MGFLHVNLENYNPDAVLPYPVYQILLTLSFFLIWLDYSKEDNKTKRLSLQALGIAILIVLAIVFKGGTNEEPEGLKPYWWGILGLIGWSYLICATLFLLAKERLAILVISLLFFLTFNVAYHAGANPSLEIFRPYFWIVGNAAMPAFTMAGVVVSVLYSQLIRRGNQKLFWTAIVLIGVAFLVFGFVTRPFGGISKIRDTPSWVGICTGIAILVFALMIYIIEVKGKQQWFQSIRPAGTSTLTCYLIPYLLYSTYNLLHIKFPPFLSDGVGGIIRSIATAFLVIFITGLLERKRIRLSV
jgi:hypothetical protein